MGYGLGVDLGTTFTAAAVVVDGRPDVVSLGDRAPEVPSVVFLREDGVSLVGEPALRRGSAQPDRLAREFKRRLGDATPLVLGGQPVAAEVLTGRMLRWVVDEVAERQGRRRPERIVVTFPAIWGPFRREMLEHAILLAEVGRVELAPEPVAAALHFASAQRVPIGDTVAVYDLGGGTFDAAVLRHTERGFELLGTPTGLEHLGGLDFDEAVFRHVVATLGDAVTDLDPEDAEVTEALARLRRECTEAKEHLSVDTDAVVQVTLPTARRAVRLTRGEFEEMIRPSVAETVASLRRALTSAAVTPLELSAVVLVGGSARVPLVAQTLGHELGRPVTLDPAPKHAVALGAALLARGASGRSGGGPRGAGDGRGGSGGRPSSPSTLPGTTAPPGPAPGVPAGAGSMRSAPQEVATATATAPGGATAAPPGGATGTEPATASGTRRRGPLGGAPTVRAASGATRVDGAARSLTRLRSALVGLPLLAVLLAFALPLLLPPGRTVPASVVDGPDGGRLFAVDVPEGGTGQVTANLSILGLRLHSDDGASVEADRLTATVPGAADFQTLGGLVVGPMRLSVGAEDVGTLVRFERQYLGLAAVVLMALFVIAYSESLQRGIRRHRRARTIDLVGMAVVGLLAGVVVALAGWTVSGLLAVDGAEVLTAGVLVCCGAAGVCLALHVAGTSRRGSRRGPNRP